MTARRTACGGVVVADARDAAARGGLRAGDRIVGLNGSVPLDVLDLEDAAADGTLWLSVLRDGHPLDLVVTPRAGEWHGISLDRGGLGDDPRTCRNACRFCFVDQVPHGAARRAVREGRRLPPLVPARQLHDADEPRRGRPRTHRGAAPLAALRLPARVGRRRPRPPHGAGGGRIARRPRTAGGGGPRAAPAGGALPRLERRRRARRDRAPRGRARGRRRPRRRPRVPGRRGRPAPGDGGRGAIGHRGRRGLAAGLRPAARRGLRARRRRVLPARRRGSAGGRRARAVRERRGHLRRAARRRAGAGRGVGRSPRPGGRRAGSSGGRRHRGPAPRWDARRSGARTGRRGARGGGRRPRAARSASGTCSSGRT